MNDDDMIILFHCPQSRSTATLTLLQELGAPYELQILNMKAGEQRKLPYLAINPLGKVPAVLHGPSLITEQVAIFLYLCDLFPKAGLAPAIGDPLRGPYLRWMVYYAACYEPAIVDKSLNRDPGPRAMSPYGDFDLMFATLMQQLEKSRYLLGDKFSAVDVLWGAALNWAVMFKLVPENPTLLSYVQLINRRDAFQQVSTIDAELLEEHEAAISA